MNIWIYPTSVGFKIKSMVLFDYKTRLNGIYFLSFDEEIKSYILDENWFNILKINERFLGRKFRKGAFTDIL